MLNAEYFQHHALNYTMFHDDGRVEGLEEADIVLIGVSRLENADSIYPPIAASNRQRAAGARRAVAPKLGLTRRWWSGFAARSACADREPAAG